MKKVLVQLNSFKLAGAFLVFSLGFFTFTTQSFGGGHLRAADCFTCSSGSMGQCIENMSLLLGSTICSDGLFECTLEGPSCPSAE